MIAKLNPDPIFDEWEDVDDPIDDDSDNGPFLDEIDGT